MYYMIIIIEEGPATDPGPASHRPWATYTYIHNTINYNKIRRDEEKEAIWSPALSRPTIFSPTVPPRGGGGPGFFKKKLKRTEESLLFWASKFFKRKAFGRFLTLRTQ